MMTQEITEKQIYKKTDGTIWELVFEKYGRAYRKNGKRKIIYFSRRNPCSFRSFLLLMVNINYDEYRNGGHKRNQEINMTIYFLSSSFFMPILVGGNTVFYLYVEIVCLCVCLFIIFPISYFKAKMDYDVAKKTNWSYSSYIELKWAKKRKKRLDELRKNRVLIGKDAYMEKIKLENKKRYKGGCRISWIAFIFFCLVIIFFLYVLFMIIKGF